MNTEKKAKGRSGIFKNSIIISALLRFFGLLGSLFSESFFGYLLCGNRKRVNGVTESLISEKLRFKQRISIPFKRFMARSSEGSFIIKKISDTVKKIPMLYTKAVGNTVFAFGICVSFSFLVKGLVIGLPWKYPSEISVGVSAAFIGGALSASSKTLSATIKESKILSFVFFKVFGINENSLTGSGKPRGRGDTAFLIGISAGLLAYFTSPKLIAATVLFLIVAYTVLVSPETGVILIILAFPFIEIGELAFICLYATAAWLLKLMRGKRSFSTISLDIAVLSFAVILFFGGIISVSPEKSFASAITAICLLSSYFLTVNLIRTSAWLYRAVNALVISLSAVSVMMAFQRLFPLLPFEFAKSNFFSDALSLISSVIVSPDEFSAILLLVLPFLLVFNGMSKNTDHKIGLIFLSGCAFVGILSNGIKGNAFALIASLILLAFLYGKKAFPILIFAIISVPTAVLLLPHGARDGIFQIVLGSKSSYLSSGIEKLLNDCFACGIGFGEDALMKAFPFYSHEKFIGIFNTCGLYSGITISVGITGLIVFAAVILVFFRHFAVYYSDLSNSDKRLRLTAASGFTGIFALLVCGLSNYVWSDHRVYLMFWTVLGLTSAAIRISAREKITSTLEGDFIDLDIKTIRRGISRKKRSDNAS